jgi:uncharacterized integral membrane protein
MRDSEKSLSLLIRKYKNILSIILLFIFIIIIASYEDGRINFNFSSDWLMPLIALIFVVIIFVILYETKIINKRIIFKEKEITVTGKLFGIKIFDNNYSYDDINKFIIGRFYSKLYPQKNYYSIYIDNNAQILKMYTLDTYKECLEIAEEINKKTEKKIYDDTDACYLMEEDLFRNYYKLKKTLNGIKNSG